jgi:predicted ATPase
VLRVREPFSGSLAQTLAAELKGLHALVVLDNCEHLIQACAQLAQTMLEGVWELTILATSREPLAIPGEQVFALSPLALPGAGADVAAVGESEAVRLFVDRAHSHQPDFELTPERSAVVAELCVRLDGIPLALELAAARIRSLSVEQIAARLGDRFRLLTAGSRTALPRHGTLRAALDWSYDLLSGEERSVLRRLAVFSGSFTLESACVVASSDEVDEFAVTDILHQLVSRSLVIADAERVRYRLLETTRAYAREQLAEAGEADALRARHARHYRGFFEGAADAWVRLTDREWSALFEVELDNLRAAFDFASGDLATGLAAASGPVWSTTGLVGEGLRYLEAAALGLDQSTAARDQARIWLWLAMLLDASPARAAAAYERSVALYRRLDDPFWRAYALMRSARVLAEIGRVDDARAVLAESLPVLRESGLPRIVGLHREYEGFVELMVGNAELARRLKEEALGLYRQIGAEALALDALGNLADVIWALGDLDAAVAAFRETLAMLRQSPLSRKRSLGFTLANFAGALVERGDLGEALAAGREGLGYLRDGGYAWIFMDHFAARAAAAGETARAARLGGFAEHAYLSRNAMRQPNEARARTRWQARLRETLDAETMTRLGEEGAAMSEADACALALLPDRPSGVRFPAAGPEVQAGPAREGPTRAGASREMH